MPTSFTGLDGYFIEDLRLIKPATLIDVGVGYGKIGDIVRRNSPETKSTGYEVFPKYISEEVRRKYEHIVIADFLDEYDRLGDFWCDLIVFGDVLEHFNYSAAMDVLHTANYRCRWIALFTPLSYVQGSFEGNIHERHQCIIGLRELAAFNIAHYVKNLQENIIYCLLRGLP